MCFLFCIFIFFYICYKKKLYFLPLFIHIYLFLQLFFTIIIIKKKIRYHTLKTISKKKLTIMVIVLLEFNSWFL
jgi:hypothetical protein